MALPYIVKQPGETRLVIVDFKSKMSSGETVVSVDSTNTDPAGLTFASETELVQSASVLVSGGSAPSRTDIDYNSYKMTMTITTSAGQILEEETEIRVKEV